MGIEKRMISGHGSTRGWRKLRARVIREEPVCMLRLRGCTIRSTEADHIVPLKHAPWLGMERSNLRGACRSCNRRRQAIPDHKLGLLRERQAPARALEFFG